jgi:hypothetical protein
MKRAWFIWLSATVILVAYAMAGFIASYSNAVEIRLEPGSFVEVTLLRLAEDRLRMELEFHGDHGLRPELGGSVTRTDGGRLAFQQAGSSVRMTASTGSSSVLYEAMPRSGYGLHTVYRNMTSDLSLEPGIWQWPPDLGRDLVVHRGLNTVKIQAVSVEAPLVGEVVKLSVIPPLTFKACMPSVCWLWWWNLWPLIMLIQTIWAAGLFIGARSRLRRREQREAKS